MSRVEEEISEPPPGGLSSSPRASSVASFSSSFSSPSKTKTKEKTVSSKKWKNAVSVQALCKSLREGQAEIAALQVTLNYAQEENKNLLEQMKEASNAYERRLAAETARADDAESELEQLRKENEMIKSKLAENSAVVSDLDRKTRTQLDYITHNEKKWSALQRSHDMLRTRILNEWTQKNRAHTLRCVFRAWSYTVTHRTHRSRVLRIYISRMGHHKLLQAFHSWKLKAHQLTVGQKAILRMLGRRDRRDMIDAFGCWRERTMQLRRLCAVMRKFASRNRRFNLFCGFRELLAHMHCSRSTDISKSSDLTSAAHLHDRKKMALRLINKAVKHWQHTKLRQGFNTLHIGLHKDRHRTHVVRLVINKTLRRELYLGFTRWRETAVQEGHKLDVLVKMSKRMQHREYLRAWHSWTIFMERRRAVQGVLDHVAGRSRRVTHAILGRLLRLNRRCLRLHGMMRWIAHTRGVTAHHLRRTEKHAEELKLNRSVDQEAVQALHHQREWLARKHMMTIAAHTGHRVLLTCFRSWAALVRLKNHKRQAFEMAARHWLHARMAKSFESWKRMHQERQHKKRILLKYADHMMHLLLARGWNTWRSGIARFHHQHQVMGHMMKRMTHQKLYRAFRGWHAGAKTQRRVRGTVLRCFERILHQKTFAAMNTWVSVTRTRKKTAVTISRFAARWRHAALLRSWNKWHLSLWIDHHDNTVENLHVEHLEAQTSARMVLLRRVVLHVTHVTLSRAWASWTQHMQMRTHRTAAVRCMLMRWTRRSLELGFRSWCAHTHVHRHNELDAYCQSLEEKIDAGQREFVEKQKTHWRRQVAEKVVERLRHSRLWRFFHTWVVYHQHEQKTRQLLIKCRQHMLHRTSLRAWNSWTAFCARRNRARRVISRTLAGWNHRDLLRAFHKLQTGVMHRARLADLRSAAAAADAQERAAEERIKKNLTDHRAKRRQVAQIAGRILGRHVNRHDMKLSVFYALDRNRHDQQAMRRVLIGLARNKGRVAITSAWRRWHSFSRGHANASRALTRVRNTMLRRAPLRRALRIWKRCAHVAEIETHHRATRERAAATMVRASSRWNNRHLHRAMRTWRMLCTAAASEQSMVRWVERNVATLARELSLSGFSTSSRNLYDAVSRTLPRIIGADRCALFLFDDYGATLRSVIPRDEHGPGTVTKEQTESDMEINVMVTKTEEASSRGCIVRKVARSGRKSVTVLSKSDRSSETKVDTWAFHAGSSSSDGRNVPSGDITSIHVPIKCGPQARIVGVMQVLLSSRTPLTPRLEILVELACHFVATSISTNLLRTELNETRERMNRIQIKHDALEASAKERDRDLETKEQRLRKLDEENVSIAEMKIALQKMEDTLEAKELEIAEAQQEIHALSENEASVAELEQERILLAMDVQNLRTRLTRAEADNLFLSGTMRQMHGMMRRKNLTMQALGVSSAHIREIFRICDDIEKARMRATEKKKEESAFEVRSLRTPRSERPHHILTSPRLLRSEMSNDRGD